jgi:hypothetical protein
MQHCFAKVSKGPEAFAVILHGIGVPAPHLLATLTILTRVEITEKTSTQDPTQDFLVLHVFSTT